MIYNLLKRIQNLLASTIGKSKREQSKIKM